MHNESFPGYALERLVPKAPVFLVTCPKMVHALLSADPDGARVFPSEVWRQFGGQLSLNSRHGVSLGEVEADGGHVRPDVRIRHVRAQFLEHTEIETDTATAANLAAQVVLYRTTVFLQLNGAEPKARERSSRTDNGYLVIPASHSNRIMLAAIAHLVTVEMNLGTKLWGKRVSNYI